jgi:hypothetical protein
MLDQIIAYENGELSYGETVELFSQLVKSGRVFNLQGHYHRVAVNLIQDGVLDPEGNITQAFRELEADL